MPRLRGAFPSPRHRLASARPHKITMPTPPQFLWLPKQLSMWLNDTYGVCVTAEEAFAKACNLPEVFVPDVEVERWAAAHGVLNGADLVTVLDYMVNDGFHLGGGKGDDGPHVAVDWTDAAILTNAIAQGPVKIGVAADQLERVVPDPVKNGWLAIGFRKDDNLDHCVSLCGFGPMSWLGAQLGHTGLLPAGDGYALFTWSTVGIIDVPSMVAITGEAWLRNPTTILTSARRHAND